MMLYPAMNKLKSHIPNRYMLVNVVALRARQIADDAEEAGVKAGDVVRIKISGTGRSLIFDDVSVSQTNSSHTSVHIDTDEANAAGMSGAMMGELLTK